MDSVPGGVGRVLLLQEVEQHALRCHLISLYREDKRYQWAIEQDLRGLWRAIRQTYPGMRVGRFTLPPRFCELRDIAEEQTFLEQFEGKPRDEQLSNYIY